MNQIKKSLFMATLIVLLSACGGSGSGADSSANSPANPNPGGQPDTGNTDNDTDQQPLGTSDLELFARVWVAFGAMQHLAAIGEETFSFQRNPMLINCANDQGTVNGTPGALSFTQCASEPVAPLDNDAAQGTWYGPYNGNVTYEVIESDVTDFPTVTTGEEAYRFDISNLDHQGAQNSAFMYPRVVDHRVTANDYRLEAQINEVRDESTGEITDSSKTFLFGGPGEVLNINYGQTSYSIRGPGSPRIDLLDEDDSVTTNFRTPNRSIIETGDLILTVTGGFVGQNSIYPFQGGFGINLDQGVQPLFTVNFNEGNTFTIFNARNQQPNTVFSWTDREVQDALRRASR